MGYLLKILLVGVVFYYVIKLLGRLLIPQAIRDLGKNIKNSNKNGYYQHKKEGEVTIDYKSKKNKPGSNNIGEYVDFEEIKD